MNGDDLNHYVAKAAITRSVVEGIPARALCGELVDCESQGAKAMPGRETANRDLAICPECELFYNGLRARQEAKEPAHA